MSDDFKIWTGVVAAFASLVALIKYVLGLEFGIKHKDLELKHIDQTQEKESTSMAATIATLTADIRSIREEQNDAKVELASVKKDIDTHSKTSQDTNVRLANVERDVNVLRGKLDFIITEISSGNQQRARLEGKIDELLKLARI